MKKIYKLITMPLVALSIAPNLILATSCSNYDHLFFDINVGKMQITFCDRGAGIYSMKYDGVDVTYQPLDKTAFINPKCEMYHFGKIIGRVCGRIKNGKLSLDGKTYDLQINEKGTNKSNTIHGGYDGLSFKDFKHYITKDSSGTTIAFNYLSQAGEAGFPETVDTWVFYKINNDGTQLDTSIYAIPSGRTILDITNHTYFRLGKSDNIKNHYLTISASKMAELDQSQIAQKQIDVKTEWDFRTAKTIGQDLEKVIKADPVCNGYDNMWIFDGKTTETRYVLLQNPDTNISLRVDFYDETSNAVNCYANCYPTAGLIMNDGKINTQYGALAIEPQTYHTGDDFSPIIHSPENPFFRKFSYKFSNIN